MKKTIIGSVIFLSGILVTMFVLISSIMLFPTIGTWSGSRLLKAISVHDLGLPFAIGIIFSLIGLIILIFEFFSKDN